MLRYTNISTGNNYLDEGLENYLMHGLKPGGFLTAVLANDLFGAANRADHWNRQRLPEIVNEILHKVPSLAIGSYEAVDDWCKDTDGVRSTYARIKEKELAVKLLKTENNSQTSVYNDPPF